MKLVLLLAAAACIAGCTHEQTVRPVASTRTTSAFAPAQKARGPVESKNVLVSADVARLCGIRLGDVEQAPKFAFDDSSLDRRDRDVLAQIAKCFTTGPLAGRNVRLVGHTDPRGEPEYNMTLGAFRADATAHYLEQLGVAAARIHETSRGELDASGIDEASWQRDRRVDVELE